MDLIDVIKNGTITFPKLLFQHYKTLGMNDAQILLVLHLLVFQDEGKMFPTIQELENRMSLSQSQIMKELQALVASGYLQLQQDVDHWGRMTEYYDLTPLYKRLTEFVTITERKKREVSEVDENIFLIFEQEFGRPLSPIEIDYINQWIDQDGYPLPLIAQSLNEAKVVGKLSFRYIDRILLEWSNQGIKTVEEAQQYSMRFRTKQFEKMEQSKVKL